MSTRLDLIGKTLTGKTLTDELAQLRADTPADGPAVAIGLIKSESRGKIDSQIADFAVNALASASIGQLHRATHS